MFIYHAPVRVLMTTAYTREFIADYEPFDDICKTEQEKKDMKKNLKERGFQVIRTKWLSSLGYYQVVGTRYRHGKPDAERLAWMRKTTRTC
jgi:hypothetical protein